MWRTLEDFNATVPENQPVSQKQYNRLTGIMQKLAKIHPAVMPAEVRELLLEHKRNVQKSG